MFCLLLVFWNNQEVIACIITPFEFKFDFLLELFFEPRIKLCTGDAFDMQKNALQ